MNKPLSYRRGTIDDLQELIALGIASYGVYSDVLTKANWKQMLQGLSNGDTYKQLLEISRCFVCTHEAKIVGMIYLVPSGNPTDIYQNDWCYIRFLGVHPDFCNRGIARTLMNNCIDYARKCTETTVALHTSEFMDAGRHLYVDMGFQQLKEIPKRFGKKYWLYTLELHYNNT